jgi:hypothetical protein
MRGFLVAAVALMAVAAGAQTVRFPDIPADPGPARERALGRIAGGAAIAAVISVPGADATGGDLVDPRTLRVTVGGRAADWRLHWRLPSVALVAVLPPPDSGSTTETLAIEAILYPSGRRVRGSLEVPPRRTHQPAGGPSLLVRDEAGRPLSGAFVFGQAVEGLLTRTDASGAAPLEQFRRGQREPHTVWAQSHWAAIGDPRTSPTMELRRIARADADAARKAGAVASAPLAAAADAPTVEAAPASRIRIEVTDARGRLLAPACIEVNERYWLFAPRGFVEDVPAPPGSHIVALAPGFRAGAAPARGDVVRVTLAPVR